MPDSMTPVLETAARPRPEGGKRFTINTEFRPSGDQPTAIAELAAGIRAGERSQVLLGATGTGKTYTMAKVIEETQRPAIVLAHNKTLAAQLYGEFKAFFPDNAVEYFVSYYDYYQPEAYVPRSDTYIEKESQINEQIDRMRHAATRSLLERDDVIIVASVSCIYGIGSPETYTAMTQDLIVGEEYVQRDIMSGLVAQQYRRNDNAFQRGTFRVRGDSLEIWPSHLEDRGWRLSFFGDQLEAIAEFDTLTGARTDVLEKVRVYANSHYVTPVPTMKQAIQEGFILDVLAHYTPGRSYYRLAKTVEEDPEFDVKRAQKKLRRFVESHEHAIRLKAEIMVDHFHEQVLNCRKIGGEARALVVTNGIERAIQHFQAISQYLRECKSPCRVIVAFSGEHEYGGTKVSEASLNGFPSSRIAEQFREDPYRFLVCADKFQTGYDEPLLHTMYVDKTLSGIKAVQTLSRLNRAHPKKDNVFVLDFLNDTDAIRNAFAPFYRATILADETDPNRLHDLQADLDRAQVYSDAQVENFVGRYIHDGAGREQLDPILDACVEIYRHDLDEDAQVDFKGKAKGFLRTYAFLSSLLLYTNAKWEERSIFLNFLVPKLPAPKEEDLSRGILDAIDMDSYRLEKQAMQRIPLTDEDVEI